ncbi:MAG: hypothetical protein GX181_00560 [Synergistaceae bacterium]|nr:hypothetical protein [Synergistota bacterium]NLM70435.1 hypothetical protein [Synergistaceae bacterium]
MPHLRVISSGGASSRRLLASELEALKKKGRAHASTREGGDWHEIISAGQTMGLFEERRVTVVESAEKLGPFPDELIAGLEDEDAVEVLLLVYEKDPGKTFPPAAKKKMSFVKGESVPYWSSQRKRWLLDIARGQGAVLDDAAAALLVELLDDPEEVRTELDKLTGYADGARIDADMVKRLSFDEGRNLMLKFLDSFCQGRASDVLALMERFKREPSVLPLLTGLYNRIRPAFYLGALPPAAAARAMRALKINDYPIRMAKEALRHYSPSALSELAFGLVALSWREKSTLAEGWPGFEVLVLKCMGEAGSGG